MTQQIAVRGLQFFCNRLIKGGGVRINNNQVKDENYSLTSDDIIDGRLVLLATGKKNKLVLQIV